MEAKPSGVCQAAEEGKESEDGRGGCVVGGSGVGGRRQGRRSVRESEEGSEGELGCRRTVGPAVGDGGGSAVRAAGERDCGVEWSGGFVSESENVWGVGYCRVGFLNFVFIV